MKRVVLLADNDSEFRTVLIELLGDEDYDVREASNPEETRSILDKGGIDVAVIDQRLVDDGDKNDRSGIVIAVDPLYAHVPKVILTAFKIDQDDAFELLGIDRNRIPAATRILTKPEAIKKLARELEETGRYTTSPEAVISLQEVGRAIVEAPAQWAILRNATSFVTDQIREDHKVARQQAKEAQQTARYFATFGGIIVIIGIALALTSYLEIGVVVASGGLLIEVVTALFYSRVTELNRRIDTVYHTELVHIHRLELLLAYSEPLSGSNQEQIQTDILRTVALSWFPASRMKSSQDE